MSSIRMLSSLLHRLLNLRLLLTLGAAASLLLVQLRNFADDPGLGWHLALGRWIWQTHSLPLRDPFLHYVTEAPRWICDQWLSDIVLYALHLWGSWTLLYAVLLLIYLLSFFGGLNSFLLSEKISFTSSLLVSALCFKLAQVHFIARPVIFNVPLLIASYAIGHRILNNRASRLHLALFPLLLAVWANIHGSFVVGLAIGLWALGLRGLLALRTQEYSLAFRASAFAVVLFLSTLLTPYGLSLYANIFTQVGSEYFVALLQEWRPLTLSGFEGRVFVFSLIVLLLLFLSQLRSLSLKVVFELCLALGFAWYSYKHTRMLPVYAIVAALPLARGLDAFWSFLARMLQGRSELPTLFKAFDRYQSRFSPSFSFFLLFPAAFLLFCYLSQDLPLAEKPLGPSAEKYPFAAVNYLKTVKERARLPVVAAHPNWGGFITFYGEGEVKAIIDDRNRMRGEAFYKEFFDTFQQSRNLRVFLQGVGAEYLLVEADSSIRVQNAEGQEFPTCHQDAVSRLLVLGDECPQ